MSRRWMLDLKPALPTVLALLLALPTGLRAAPSHRTLELKNNFKSAREVLAYFVERDSEGFLWSGFLESERSEFTTWKASPASDSFYLARKAAFRELEKEKTTDREVIEVTYDLESVKDSAGTSSPPPMPSITVRYVLLRIGEKWKVSEPEAHRFTPVLLTSKVRPVLSPSR